MYREQDLASRGWGQTLTLTRCVKVVSSVLRLPWFTPRLWVSPHHDTQAESSKSHDLRNRTSLLSGFYKNVCWALAQKSVRGTLWGDRHASPRSALATPREPGAPTAGCAREAEAC